MSISLLRQIVTNEGGTPGATENGFTALGLIRELTKTIGGTPTQFTLVYALRELIVAAGGTPTQFTTTALLRELVTTLGGTPQTFSNDALLAQVQGLGFGPASYTGQVASRTGPPTHSLGVGNEESFARTSHYVASDDGATMQLVFVGWGQFTGAEFDAGASISVTASVEYPEATLTQVLFSGMATGTVPNGGVLISDPTPRPPLGSKFWTRNKQVCASGAVCWFMNNADGISGETDYGFGASIPDRTMSGATNFANGHIYGGPAAIIGTTTLAAVAVLGDSRTAAGMSLGAPVDTSTGTFGAVMPGFKNLAYINFSRQSTPTDNFLAAAAPKRIAHLAPYCSHIFNAVARNNFAAGATAAQLITAYQQIKADWGGLPTVTQTCEPETTSSDAWATLVNQTTVPSNAERVSFNTTLRASPAWAAGNIDLASITESSLNSGKWVVGYTADGVHDNATGYNAQKTSNIFPNAIPLFVR